MDTLLKHTKLTVFDLETTGFDPKTGDTIIEIGAVTLRNGEISDTFQTLVDPGQTIPNNIQELTGITNGMLRGAPGLDYVLPKFLDFIEDSVLVAHNVDFDKQFINHFSSNPIDNPTIDTLHLSRTFLSTKKNGLDHLVSSLNLDRDDDHRALEDSKATAQLLLHISDKINGLKDYWKANLPVEMVKQDLDIALQKSTDLSPKQRREITENHDTVSEFIKNNQRQITEKENLDSQRMDHVLEQLQNWIDFDHRWDDLQPEPGILDSCHPRYWGWSNWIFVFGSIVAASIALLRETSTQFYSYLLLATCLFLCSTVITYFRNTRYAILKQLIFSSGILTVGLVGYLLIV